MLDIQAHREEYSWIFWDHKQHKEPGHDTDFLPTKMGIYIYMI